MLSCGEDEPGEQRLHLDIAACPFRETEVRLAQGIDQSHLERPVDIAPDKRPVALVDQLVRGDAPAAGQFGERLLGLIELPCKREVDELVDLRRAGGRGDLVDQILVDIGPEDGGTLQGVDRLSHIPGSDIDDGVERPFRDGEAFGSGDPPGLLDDRLAVERPEPVYGAPALDGIDYL